MKSPVRLASIVPATVLAACAAIPFACAAQETSAASDAPSIALDESLVEDANASNHFVYTVKILDIGTGPAAFGEAINNHAQVVGDRFTPDQSSFQAVIWNGRKATKWQAFARPYSIAWDINDAGLIVGTAFLHNDQVPVQWRGFKPSELKTIGGDSGEAYAVNAYGQIAGYSSTTNNQEAHATLWKKDGKPIDLGTLGGTLSIARGINDAGDVVGYSRIAGSDDDYATLWKNGKAYNLGTLGGTQSHAEAINNKGQIVGYRDIGSDANRHAVLWEKGKGKDLGTLGGAYSQAYAINRAGFIVGISSNSKNQNRGTLWHGSQIVDINTLLAPGTKGITVIIAWDINDYGEILAAGDTPKGDRYMILTPKKR